MCINQQTEGGILNIKVDKRIYRYIEYELYHYQQYKREIKEIREEILESGSFWGNGTPRGNKIGNPTEDKTVKLMTTPALLQMEKIIKAVENVLPNLSKRHREIFDMVYIKGRTDRYMLCDELHISYETFNLNRREIVFKVGCELGVIKTV